MTDRLLFLAAVLVLVIAGLYVATDETRVAAISRSLGIEPAADEAPSGVARLDPPVIEAELDRLAALPLPGIETRAGTGGQTGGQTGAAADRPAPTLGDLAAAGTACAVEGMMRPPKTRARAALRRYLLVLGAAGADPETPLLEPRLRGLSEVLAAGPRAVQAALARGTLTDGQRTLLAEFHSVYREVDHPLYHGLQVYDLTFEALDFQALADGLARHPAAGLDCALAAVLPARKKTAEGAAPGDAAPAAVAAGSVGE